MRSLLAAVCIMCGHSSAELGDDVNFTSYNIIGPIHGERDAYSALGVRRLAGPDAIRRAMWAVARKDHPGRCNGHKWQLSAKLREYLHDPIAADPRRFWSLWTRLADPILAGRLLLNTFGPDQVHWTDPACSDESTAAFYEVQKAYSILGDWQKRRKYEREEHEAVDRPETPRFEDVLKDEFLLSVEMTDVASMRLHFGFREGEERRTPNLGATIPITLEQVNSGHNVSIMLDKKVLCPVCNGTGAHSHDDLETCPLCNGHKHIEQEHSFERKFTQHIRKPCPLCEASGKIARRSCGSCLGAKVVPHKSQKDIVIEPGTPDGYQYTYKEEAEEDPGATAGDVVVQITNEPHPYFERDESDLLWTTNITLMEALLGFERNVTHLDGRVISFVKRNVTRHGDRFIVGEEGLPVFGNPNKRGDIIVTFNVIFPKKVDKDRASALRSKRKQRKGAKSDTSSSAEQPPDIDASKWDNWEAKFSAGGGFPEFSVMSNEDDITVEDVE